jgi:hypothetical protein
VADQRGEARRHGIGRHGARMSPGWSDDFVSSPIGRLSHACRTQGQFPPTHSDRYSDIRPAIAIGKRHLGFRPHFERIRIYGVQVSPPTPLMIRHYRFSPHGIRLIQVVGVMLEYPGYDAGPPRSSVGHLRRPPLHARSLADGLETFHRALKGGFGALPRDGAGGVTP